LLSLGDFRALSFSLSVTRGDGGLEDEFEWFMQLLGTYFHLLSCSHWHSPPDLSNIGYQISQDHKRSVEFSQSMFMINRRPPQEDIDASRPVMDRIEHRLELQCGMEGLTSHLKEWCQGVLCPPISTADRVD